MLRLNQMLKFRPVDKPNPHECHVFLDRSTLEEANYELSARHASTARPTLERVSLISGRESEATNLPSF